MRTTILSAALVALLVPAASHAAAPSLAGVSGVAVMHDDDRREGWRDDDPRCGRGNAWGCRRDRDDDRYDRRADRWERERWERARWERERERERYERARWERERWERARYRARYGYDRRYERYDGYAVACLRAGGRVLGAVLVVCVP